MEVRSLHSLIVQNQAAQKTSQLENIQNATPNVDFTERFSEGLSEVARAQNNASELAKAYELGTETDLAKVMVAQQVSSLGFQMTLNVRNKALSAYKDIMNMPV
jgi:flagellar hook-basal body complex protein FliE